MSEHHTSPSSTDSAIIEGVAPRLNSGSCETLSGAALAPCTIVIFGASGDLTARKLVPALYTLFISDSLPEQFSIVGVSRTEMRDDEFREKLRDHAAAEGRPVLDRWPEFAAHLFYQAIDYEAQSSYGELADYLETLDGQRQTGGNRIFYLAVPPTLYPVIGAHLGTAGLAREGEEGTPWARIVVEKPFGRDLESAVALDRTLHASFREHQIFRIDHYLAKETVQSILMLRFANAIFEPLWNRSYIDYIGIIAAEKLGVEHRAGYYEQAGILRDMFQNHMMQLLALTAMEPPSLFHDARVQDEKIKVFRALKPLQKEKLSEHLILGQYGPGQNGGAIMPGYRQEPGVSPDSLTPTFAMMRLFIDNWRWRDVPFYLVSGKRLASKETKIVVQFKKVPHLLFRDVLAERIAANRLILGIHPDEEITLTFQTKMPGTRVCLRPVTMDFKYYDDYNGPTLEAYEKVLLDCIQGDHTLFWRQDGVELSWSFLTPILSACEQCGEQADLLQQYAAGSWGPEAAREWMAKIIE